MKKNKVKIKEKCFFSIKMKFQVYLNPIDLREGQYSSSE